MTDFINRVTYNQNTPNGTPKSQSLGKLTLLLGNNGAGKSAIIKAIVSAATGQSYDVASEKTTGPNGFAMLTGAQADKLVNEVSTDKGRTSKVVVTYTGTVQSPALAQSNGCPEFVFPVPLLEADAVAGTSGGATEERLLRWHGTSVKTVVTGIGPSAVEALNESGAESFEEFGKWLKSQKRKVKSERDLLEKQLERGKPGGLQPKDLEQAEARLEAAEKTYRQAVAYEAHQALVNSQVTPEELKEKQIFAEAAQSDLDEITPLLTQWQEYEENLAADLKELSATADWWEEVAVLISKCPYSIMPFALEGKVHKGVAELYAIEKSHKEATNENIPRFKQQLAEAGEQISKLTAEKEMLEKQLEENSQWLDNYQVTLKKLEESAPDDPGVSLSQAEAIVKALRKEVSDLTHYSGVALRNKNRQKAIDKKHDRYTFLDGLQAKMKTLLKETVDRVQSEIEEGVSSFLPDGWEYKILRKHLGRQCFLRCLKKGDGPWAYDPSGAEGVALLVAESLYVSSRAATGAVTVVIPPDKGWDPETLTTVLEALATQETDAQVILQSTVAPTRKVEGWTVVDLSPESRKKSVPHVSFGPDEYHGDSRLDLIGPGGKWPAEGGNLGIPTVDAKMLSVEVTEINEKGAEVTETISRRKEVVKLEPVPQMGPPLGEVYRMVTYETLDMKELKKKYREITGNSVKKGSTREDLLQGIEEHYNELGRDADAEESARRLAGLSVEQVRLMDKDMFLDTILVVPEKDLEDHVARVAYYAQVSDEMSPQAKAALRRKANANGEPMNFSETKFALQLTRTQKLMLEALGYPPEAINDLTVAEAKDKVANEEVYRG